MIQCQETLALQKDNHTFLLLSPGIILIIHLHTCYCLRMVMVKTTDTNVLLLFHVFQSMKKMIEYPFYCYLYKTISKNNVAYMFIVLDYIYANNIYIARICNSYIVSKLFSGSSIVRILGYALFYSIQVQIIETHVVFKCGDNI